jgi:hypothetical protein
VRLRRAAAGHDQRGIHDGIGGDFGGSVSRFIDWHDANGPFASAV